MSAKELLQGMPDRALGCPALLRQFAWAWMVKAVSVNLKVS